MPNIGFHLGNRGNGPTPAAQNVITTTKAKLLLAMDNIVPGIDDANRKFIIDWAARNPDGYLVLRKYYSNGQGIIDWANGQVEMAENYLQFSEIRKIYENGRLGIKIFNEPNFDFEGWGWSEDALKRYNGDFIVASNYIKERLPNAKSIVYSLAPGNGDVYFSGDKVNEHYWFHGPEAAKDNPTQVEINAAYHSCLTKDAKMAADWFGIHIYPHPGDWDKLWRGRRFERYWQFMPEHLRQNTFVLEASVADEAGQVTRANETYLWLEMLRNNYPDVRGVALWWLRDGDYTWEKHFFTNEDGSFRPVAEKVHNFVNKYGSAPTEEPVPEPEPEPEPNPDRELINVPDWISFYFQDEEKDLAVGTRYWKLTKFEFVDSGQSGGLHHIFVREPHDSDMILVTLNQNDQRWETSLDKPENEPAANFAMWSGNVYRATVSLPKDGSVKDWVRGMYLPQNQHVAYYLTYKLVIVGETEPEPEPEPPESIGQVMRNEAWNMVGVDFNPDAYFYKYAKLYDLGRPVKQEKDVVYGKRTYRMQPYDGGIVFAEVVNGNVMIDTTDHIDWL